MARSQRITLIAIVAFIGITAGLVAAEGLILSRDWVFVWAMLGLLALSLTDVKRWLRGLVVDWLPFVGILFAYDIARGVADNVGIGAHTSTGIDVDGALFGHPIPSVWLQNHLYDYAHVHWYDYGVFAVYLTHFFATFVIAVLLWRFAYPQFRRFRTMILALTAAGFLTYVLFPATPPWLASQQGHLPYLYRIIGEMWNHTDGMYPAAGLFQNGNEYVNEVAAVPSLHAAFPVMFLLLFWRGARGRPWLRVLLVAYPLAMAFTLVYAGEHYVFDVLLGWIYAVAVYGAVTAAERARARRREPSRKRALATDKPLPETAGVTT
ncbi:MAG TPA: phosphatase PAP2 family protein [Gaiellales bacterium]|jgi:membrane-associated phospholipid phosphatase|nr:phosphatase PAP2 family protein [Gaiellales bacterium]